MSNTIFHMSTKLLYAMYIALCMSFSSSFPWWALFIPAITSGWGLAINKQRFLFWNGFLITGFIWLGMALLNGSMHGFDLAARLAQTFQLPNEILFLFVSFVVGGLIGGSGMLAGGAVRKIQMNE